MQLSERLDRQTLDQIETIDEREKVQYTTSIERIGIAKGLEKGVVIGRVDGASGLLRRQLECRFGVLSEWALAALREGVASQCNRIVPTLLPWCFCSA
ncbi:MAG: hypothetical protein ACOYLR_10810 [Chlorobium sp.]